MNYLELVGKTVVDRDGKKLGKITRIDGVSKNDKNEEICYLIIQIKQILRRAFHFPFSLTSSNNTRINKNQELQLDILKKEFLQMIRRYEAERKMIAKKAKLGEVSNNDTAAALSIAMGKL